MIKKTSICLVLSLVLIVSFKAIVLWANNQEELASKQELSMEDIDKFITHYYLNPQPEKLIQVLKFFLSQEQLLTDAVHFGPMEHLFATAARENKAVLSSLRALKGQYLGIQRESIDKILYQAENFISPDPHTAQDLDYLWVEFFATGREDSVKKIISALVYPPNNLEARIVAGAAEWSLTSNAGQHKKVYEIIQTEYIISKAGKIREILGNILQKTIK